MAEAKPLTSSEFAAAMAALGPFEACPWLAVAVSGGADSMALGLLADDWARSRGGRTTALTVDHGLRPASHHEAERVKKWMNALGVPHCTLRWTGAKSSTGVQAAARLHRYALLREWCWRSGVLHLLLGHHLQDQAETVLMRAMRGSGVVGLAAMPPVAERPEVRLLRPLLRIEPARLRAFLIARGQEWIDDPSNRDPVFARTRLRAALPMLAKSGWDTAALALMAERARRARATIERATVALLARGCRLHPAGFAHITLHALADVPTEVGVRTLSCLIAAIGGRSYGPSVDQLRTLWLQLIGARPMRTSTLGGCLVLPRSDQLLVCRENRGLPAPLPVGGGDRLTWDNRFLIRIGGSGRSEIGNICLGPLGAVGWRQVVRRRPDLRDHPIPFPVRLTLPALMDGEGVRNVPHLSYSRTAGEGVSLRAEAVCWRPPMPLSAAGSFLV